MWRITPVIIRPDIIRDTHTIITHTRTLITGRRTMLRSYAQASGTAMLTVRAITAPEPFMAIGN